MTGTRKAMIWWLLGCCGCVTQTPTVLIPNNLSYSHCPRHDTYAISCNNPFYCESKRLRCMCGRCVCGLDWRRGWWWGLHPKKGFLSRWHHQDWQDAILCWNSVSQPASLSVRQPLTPLNLAFCWAVTRLASTLHVAILINCTVNPNTVGTYIDGLSVLRCRYKWPKQLCPLFLLFLYLSVSRHIILFTFFTPWQHLL